MSGPPSRDSASPFETSTLLGRSLIPLVLLLFVISLGATVWLLSSAFDSLDRQAGDHQQKLVNTALRVQAQHQSNLVNEYAHWDEGHRKFVLTADSDPDSAHVLARYLFSQYAYDVVGVVGSAPGFNSLWLHGNPVANGEERISALDPAFLQDIRQRLLESKAYALSAYVTIKGKPHLASFGLFLGEYSARPVGDRSFIMFAKRLDSDLFDQIADAYQVPGLAIINQPTEVELILRDLQQKPLVYLTWQRSESGQTYVDRLLVPVVLVFLVMSGLVFALLLREKRNRVQHISQLIKLACKDFLTGISNRREFFYLGNREMNRAGRDGKPLTLLLMDLDYFKQINDQHGHVTGDQVLSEFAARVQASLRNFDIFARLGGEEFVVLLTDSPQSEALDTANRLCALVSEQPFASAEGKGIRCTVSIGLAAWNGSESIDKLLNRADDALYQAKHNGRNRVSVAQFS